MASDAPPAMAGRSRMIPLVVAFAFLLEQLDSTIITTALPDMAQSLGTTALRLDLALTAYIVTVAVFIPLSGWLADRFGTRVIFTAAIAVFTLGSVLCGLAWGPDSLVAARIIQGLGGAMMTPVGRLIMLRSFSRAELVTAMSWMSIPAILGPTMGPLLGGLVTTHFGWRWIFFVNLPFGLAGMAFAWRHIKDIEEIPAGRFDLRGFLLCALVAVLVEAAIEGLGHHFMNIWQMLAVLALAAAVMTIYARIARARSNPVLDLSLLRVRSFRVALFGGGLSRIGVNAVPFMLPLLLQVGFGYSPVHSGSVTFILALGSLVLRPFSRPLLAALGFDRLLTANTLFIAFWIAGFALLVPGTPDWAIMAAVLGFGVLRAFQFNATQTLTYADIPRPALSRATSLGGVLQQLAMGFGVSISAAMLGLVAGEGVTPSIADFHLVFLLLAGMTLVSVIGFLFLSAEDGAQVSTHVRRKR